jgi:hypothetical protein
VDDLRSTIGRGTGGNASRRVNRLGAVQGGHCAA